MRWLLLPLLALLAVLQFRLWLSDGGYREVWRLRTQVAEQEQENGQLVSRNSALEAEVLDLKEGLAAAEERARTDLGMIKRGETFYQILPADPPDSD